MTTTAAEHRRRSQYGAHLSWANTTDRAARTAAARRALEDRFEREADPDNKLRPEERAKRAANVRKAYYMSLSLKSAQARRRRKGVGV